MGLLLWGWWGFFWDVTIQTVWVPDFSCCFFLPCYMYCKATTGQVLNMFSYRSSWGMVCFTWALVLSCRAVCHSSQGVTTTGHSWNLPPELLLPVLFSFQVLHLLHNISYHTTSKCRLPQGQFNKQCLVCMFIGPVVNKQQKCTCEFHFIFSHWQALCSPKE